MRPGLTQTEVGGVLIELGYETRSDTNRGWWCFN